MAIPFSSLRYKNVDPQQWGIILFRNYPRAFRHQIVSTTVPRGGNCIVCRANALGGLEQLPGGGHLVAAPYASAGETATRRDGVAGVPLVQDDASLAHIKALFASRKREMPATNACSKCAPSSPATTASPRIR